MSGIDSYHTEEAAHRRQVARPHDITGPQIRNRKALLPSDEIMCTVNNPDRQHVEDMAGRRVGHHPPEASDPQSRGGKLMVPSEQIDSVISSLDH